MRKKPLRLTVIRVQPLWIEERLNLRNQGKIGLILAKVVIHADLQQTRDTTLCEIFLMNFA